MILKALYDYYNRSGDLAPAGWEKKVISFLIVVDKEGHFVKLEDRRIDKKVSQTFIVPKSVGRTSGINSNLLWDNTEYVLGISLKAKSTEDRVKQCHEAFVALCSEASAKIPNNKGLCAVKKFFEQKEEEKVTQDELWSEVKETHNISFLLKGELQIIAENKDLNSLNKANDDNETDGYYQICLITGNKAKPVETTTRTQIPGSKATAKLVAFQIGSGYDSWGKSKGENAPISSEAEFAYTTALNKLLSKGSKNKFVRGDRTFLFWASSNSEASKKAEEGLFALLSNNDEDDPNKNIAKVREVFKGIYSGTIKTDTDDRFYFLGLAPNAARIAVVYWKECSLKEFAENILKHFADMEIVDTRKDKKPYYGLYCILSAVTLGGKPDKDNVQPNLPEAVFKSIVEGTRYPFALYSACLRRIRAEQDVRIARAAILKAYINRTTKNKSDVMVNKENNNIGYLCGRLFATLEYEQEKANGSSNISERYLNSASTTPAAVFPTILNLSVHHEAKLQKPAQVFYSKLKGEIMDKIADEFPSHLSLDDQGRFMVGYYQQRQDFYTKKEENTNE